MLNFKDWLFLEATTDYQEKIIDPALMTWEEYWNLVNAQNKSHPENAYSFSIENAKKDEYPQKLFNKDDMERVFTKKINNISIDFRVKKTDRYENKFIKRDKDSKPLIINGEIQYYTPKELEKMGKRRWDYTFAAFDDDLVIGYTVDEWGCLLVSVAEEYQKFGIGKILTKLAWEAEPGKTTGGCTYRGKKLVRRIHGDFVRDYLKKGFYSLLVRSGQMSAERAKEIINSAYLSPSENQPRNLKLDNNPQDWLLYAHEGTFIIYNKKLKDLLGNVDEDDYWHNKAIDDAIIGLANIGGGYNDKTLRLWSLGGINDNIKKYLLLLAVSWAAQENDPLFIFEPQRKYVDPSKINLDENGWATLKGQPINIQPLANQEKKFRDSFDQYSEFYYRLLELADAKFSQ